MAGNASPIFAKIGQIGIATLAAANTGSNLSTNAALIFSGVGNLDRALPTDTGSIINEVRVKAAPAAGTTSATVFRVWINNGGSLSTIENNAILSEITIPAITYSAVAANVDFVVPMPRGGLVVPPGYRIYATIGTIGSGSFQIIAIGGEY